MTRMNIALLAAALSVAGAASASAAPAQTEAERGFAIFKSAGCWQCHGTVGQGGGAGPRLAPNPLPAATILAIVRKPLKEMPPFHQKVLPDADVFLIRAYLASVKPPPPLESIEQLKPRPPK